MVQETLVKQVFAAGRKPSEDATHSHEQEHDKKGVTRIVHCSTYTQDSNATNSKQKIPDIEGKPITAPNPSAVADDFGLSMMQNVRDELKGKTKRKDERQEIARFSVYLLLIKLVALRLHYVWPNLKNYISLKKCFYITISLQ